MACDCPRTDMFKSSNGLKCSVYSNLKLYSKVRAGTRTKHTHRSSQAVCFERAVLTMGIITCPSAHLTAGLGKNLVNFVRLCHLSGRAGGTKFLLRKVSSTIADTCKRIEHVLGKSLLKLHVACKILATLVMCMQHMTHQRGQFNTLATGVANMLKLYSKVRAGTRTKHAHRSSQAV
jgi:hypothetical protein